MSSQILYMCMPLPHRLFGGDRLSSMATERRDFWAQMPGPSVVTFGFDVLDRVQQAVAMVKERLKRAVGALEAVGFIHSFMFGINIFVDGPNGTSREAVHILFAGESVKSTDPVPAPDLSVTQSLDGYRIMDLERLITMKLTAFRLKDRVHLLDMIDVGLIDASTADRLPAELRPRLEQLLANPNGDPTDDIL